MNIPKCACIRVQLNIWFIILMQGARLSLFKSATSIEITALHGSSILHSPSVRRVPFSSFLLCFSFAVCLPSCRDADASVLGAYQRSGDEIDVMILVTQKCVGDSRPLTSAREAQCTVSSENKLRRRTWQLFLFPQWFKREKETEARGFYRKCSRCGKEEEVIRDDK